MRPVFRPASLAAAALALTAHVAAAQGDLSARAPRPSADSAYSDAQAERGAGVFRKVCVSCHAREDMASADFRVKWNDQPLFDLFRRISTSMPDDNPGGLPLADYTDVVAYILKLNGVPAGAAELAADSTAMSAARMPLPPRPAPSSTAAWGRGTAIPHAARRVGPR